jgi:hypothetical protein
MTEINALINKQYRKHSTAERDVATGNFRNLLFGFKSSIERCNCYCYAKQEGFNNSHGDIADRNRFGDLVQESGSWEYT